MCYSCIVTDIYKSPGGRTYNQFFILAYSRVSTSFHQFLLNIKLSKYDTDSCISHMWTTFDTAAFTCLPDKDNKRDNIKENISQENPKTSLRKKLKKVSYGLWKLRKKTNIPGATIIGGKARVGYNFNVRWRLDFVIYERKPLGSIILVSIIVIIGSLICPKSSQSHGQQNWKSLQVKNMYTGLRKKKIWTSWHENGTWKRVSKMHVGFTFAFKRLYKKPGWIGLLVLLLLIALRNQIMQ